MTPRCGETSRFSDRPLRIGTRGSALALAQTHLVADLFRASCPDLPVDIHVISTEGDIDKTSPLSEIGGRGVFTSAIEAAILRGEVDAAVHSAKDLPSALHPAVPIVAFPDRDDPRDVLVSRHGATLELLPPNPVIGTSSRRREVQILCLRPDARIVNIRGNIDTRLRKAAGPEFDAIVLAAAGINRMGWEDSICQYFAVDRLTPSPGQGAIAIQARAGSNAADVLEMIDDPMVSIPVGIERAFLATIGVGCTFPIGAHAADSGKGYRLIAMLADPAGTRVAWANEPLDIGQEQAHAAEIASRLQVQLQVGKTSGAGSWHGWSAAGHDLQLALALAGARILVTRPPRQAAPLIAALARRGAAPLSLPTIRVEPIADTSELDAALREASRGAFDWLVFTSANAVDVVARRMDAIGVGVEQLAAVTVAAVGPATAAAAIDAGLNLTLVPECATAEALVATLRRQMRPRARVLYPRSAIGREVLPAELKAVGIDVLAIDVYRTKPEPNIDAQVVEQVRRGEIDMITFASPSSVRNLIDLLGQECGMLSGIPVICAGPVTGQAAQEAGLLVAAVSAGPDVAAMAEAIAGFWLTRGGGKPRGESALTQRPERSAG